MPCFGCIACWVAISQASQCRAASAHPPAAAWYIEGPTHHRAPLEAQVAAAAAAAPELPPGFDGSSGGAAAEGLVARYTYGEGNSEDWGLW